MYDYPGFLCVTSGRHPKIKFCVCALKNYKKNLNSSIPPFNHIIKAYSKVQLDTFYVVRNGKRTVDIAFIFFFLFTKYLKIIMGPEKQT